MNDKINKIKPYIYVIILLIIIVLWTNPIEVTSEKYSNIFYSMDTVISMEVSKKDCTNDIQDIVESLNSAFDGYSQGCELYELNKSKRLKCSSELVNLITQSKDLISQFGNKIDITSGALTHAWNITGDTPTVPSKNVIDNALKTINIDNISIDNNIVTLNNDTILDIGSVAKGYTLDIVKSYLDDNSIGSSYFSMGSSTLLYNVEDYSIAVRSPENTEDTVCNFIINDTAYISTSGGYERFMEIDNVKYSHILDLSTGYPSNTDLTSVTVYTSDSGIKSDFLSTLIYLEGSKNIDKYLNSDDFKVIAIDKDKNIYVSNNMNINVTDNSFKVVNSIHE